MITELPTAEQIEAIAGSDEDAIQFRMWAYGESEEKARYFVQTVAKILREERYGK